jgi:cystathionine beta-lyase family protein involved in aluminum resistance
VVLTNVRPVCAAAGVTAGYGDEVIFADGTFIDGSTAELSADGPLRPPYVVYCQGGAHWTHWALALESAVKSMADAGLLPQQQQQQHEMQEAAAAEPQLLTV